MNIQYLDLDLTKGGGGQQITIAQGDAAGTTIVAAIYDSGTPLAETDLKAYFVIELPDREHYVRDTADYAEGVVTYTCNEERVAAVSGYTDNAYFELHKGDDVIASTERFSVAIAPSAYDGHTPAEDWDNAVMELIAEGTAATRAAQAATVDAIDATGRADAATADAIEATGNANTATANADAATADALSATESAIEATGTANAARDSANTAADRANDSAAATEAALEALGAATGVYLTFAEYTDGRTLVAIHYPDDMDTDTETEGQDA